MIRNEIVHQGRRVTDGQLSRDWINRECVVRIAADNCVVGDREIGLTWLSLNLSDDSSIPEVFGNRRASRLDNRWGRINADQIDHNRRIRERRLTIHGV